MPHTRACLTCLRQSAAVGADEAVELESEGFAGGVSRNEMNLWKHTMTRKE